jgi:hypothetical protein
MPGVAIGPEQHRCRQQDQGEGEAQTSERFGQRFHAMESRAMSRNFMLVFINVAGTEATGSFISLVQAPQ